MASGFACSEEADSEAGARESGDDPLGVRDAFSVTEELAYLNSASMGPIPSPVHDALAAHALERARYRDPGSRARALGRARARFARLFGAREDEIGLLYSTSDGENIVAKGIDWRPGDNVVVDELHFTTAFVLYREIERTLGVELRIVRARDGVVAPADFAAMVDDRTRLLSVAWVSNRNGFRHNLPDLAAAAHSVGAYLFADGIQAFGTFPVDLRAQGVDFACGNGYKWLFADYGCAPFYVRREHMEWLRPDRFGHRQVAEALPDHRFRLRRDARLLEYGNAAHGSVAAMDAALAFLEEVGLERVERHSVRLAGELREAAEDLGMRLFTPPETRSAIVSFYHGLDQERLAAALRSAGVAVTFQEGGSLLRASISMFNNRADVDRLLNVIDGLA